MRKKYTITACCCLLALFQTACHKQLPSGNLNGHALNGNWIGIGNAIGYDDDYRIDSMTLSISEDGILSLDDIDQDTQSLNASITVDKDDSFTIKTQEDPSSSVLPTGWNNLEDEDTISYELISDQKLLLTYENISYLFEKDSADSFSVQSPLYDLGENDVWYSNDGSKSNETTYEFELYNKYAELYSISPNNTKALLTNFFYLANDGDDFTFYTNIRNGKEYPDLLSSCPEGLQNIQLRLNCADDSLTMTYNDQDLVFYNNVIYGLKTDGDSYYLCDKSFHFIEQLNQYYCYFAMNDETQNLYLYISDKEEGEEGANTVCGEVAINEKNHSWVWYFDKERSAKTASKESDIYKKYAGMNVLKVNYSLNGSILHMETGDSKFDVMLTDHKKGEKE